MSNVSETTILQEGLVKITNLRMVIGTITYSMSDIKTVNLTKQAKSRRPFLLALGGILFVLWSILDQTGYYSEFFNIGMLLIIVGIALFIVAKPTYAVQIGSVAGKTSILSSTDISFIQKIVNAMNSAIARRG
jgi:hypothetical protein